MTHDDDADKISFAELIGTVTLLNRPSIAPGFGSKKKVSQQAKISAQHARIPTAVIPTRLIENYDAISDNLLSRLACGRVTYRRVIDLHGARVNRACNLLNDALLSRNNRRGESWLIIYGKGQHSVDYDDAPLKWAVLQLLRSSPAVSALATQHDSDGQSGSVAIYLRPSIKTINWR